MLLQVACREVNAECHSIVIGMGKLLADGFAKLVDPHHKLCLVMDVIGEIRVKEGCIIPQEGAVRFHEKHWLLWKRVVEFFGVVDVVATDADDFHGGEACGC
jgi:hypothetical protein